MVGNVLPLHQTKNRTEATRLEKVFDEWVQISAMDFYSET